MSPPLGRNAWGNTRAKFPRKHSHRPTLSDTVSGTSRRAKEQADRRQDQPLQAPQNVLVLPNGMMSLMLPMHPTFGVGHTYYVHPTTII